MFNGHNKIIDALLLGLATLTTAATSDNAAQIGATAGNVIIIIMWGLFLRNGIARRFWLHPFSVMALLGVLVTLGIIGIEIPNSFGWTAISGYVDTWQFRLAAYTGALLLVLSDTLELEWGLLGRVHQVRLAVVALIKKLVFNSSSSSKGA